MKGIIVTKKTELTSRVVFLGSFLSIDPRRNGWEFVRAEQINEGAVTYHELEAWGKGREQRRACRDKWARSR